MRLRIPLAVAAGRKLRICIVARFSTDEQKKRRRSNAAQVKYVKKQVTLELERAGITNYEFITVEDEAVSGELKDRPGIIRLRELIAGRQIDIIVCEDSSRIYRNYAFCFEIVASAYDQGIRTLCIGDDVDTEEKEYWVQRLQEAQSHHSKDNAFTRRRLERSIEDLWETGAAVGPLRPGHLREASKAATELSEAEGPYFDKLDPAHRKHLECAYKMIRSRRCPKVVARYLTKRRVPLTNGKIGTWIVRHVLVLIRNPVNRGVERFRVTKTKQVMLTGEPIQEKNNPLDVWERSMPHLRVVSDGLWYGANKAIDDRRKCPNPPQGKAHPLFGVPRESNTPMSGLLYCGICGGKMYCIGTCYRCQTIHQVRREAVDNTCWNHATGSRKLTHEKIYGGVFEALLNTESKVDVLVEGLAHMLTDRGNVEGEARSLQKQIEKLQQKCQRLQAAIEGRSRAPERLVDQILLYEDDIKKKQLQLEAVRAELQQAVEVPDCDQLLETVRATMAVVPEADHRARELLKDLIDGRIEVFPYRLVNSNRIVLRAHFALNLVNLCHEELRAGLRMNRDWSRQAEVLRVPCIIDLFDTPRYVKNALPVFEYLKTRKVREAVREFGLSQPMIKRAKRLGEAMAELQLTDPYLRLNDAPEKGSRWHRHNRANQGEGRRAS